MNSRFRPRPMQQPVIDYTGGKMGVAAVPGSGKTHTLSYLAARLIVEGQIEDDQEILIVTLVNSSVDNFSARVAGFVQEYGLLPDFGYRVRTLHGLAHDIVRERPDLAGLSDRFSIVDENEASDILRSTVAAWLRSHSEFITEYANPDVEPGRVFGEQWPALVVDLAGSIVRKAKDLQITPTDLQKRLESAQINEPLLSMGAEIYADYQRALNYRSALDFDDLIRLALQAHQCRSGLPGPAALPLALSSSKTKPRTRAGCKKKSCANYPATTATGCGWAIPTRPSMRLLPPPARNFCAIFSTSRASRAAPCPIRAVRRSALSAWPTR